MAKKINQERCIACGRCFEECPNEGIYEADGVYVIDPRLCTECAGFYEVSRCVQVCPVDAVETDPNQPEVSDEELIGLAAELRPDHFPRD
jgi:ferredoxin